ncbi:MAG: polysaccharide deacetylase family protein [Desulfarculaceae bacterium]|nr:polysaccharide deacetylase family protein [Desulfarculaceae bacterium]MCF8074188.1 polysaccharide deacetylase family protein [Desulfarculaceae bacterium]MCF8102769.1 polysaccharide deacetylase family protein [Desulfarculaceae bacterium]MCF8116376.1 polysaccharide deacetylase family protein [Desulfarculaceae bacterium]
MSWWWAALAGLGAAGFSARWHWWRPRQEGAPVLMYHQIREDTENTPLPKLRVRPGKLAAQLDYLQGHGWQGISLGRALGPDRPAKAAVLTFDDAYQDFYDTAWPIIKQRGMSATVFVVTSQIGGANLWDAGKGIPTAPLMSREQIQDLAAQGVEFGGHGHEHVDLTSLDDAALAQNLAACRDRLSDILGQPPKVFSYPYGSFDHRVRHAVKAAGFTAACSTRPGMLSAASDPLAIGRIIVKRSDTGLDFSLKLTRAKSRW